MALLPTPGAAQPSLHVGSLRPAPREGLLGGRAPCLKARLQRRELLGNMSSLLALQPFFLKKKNTNQNQNTERISAARSPGRCRA